MNFEQIKTLEDTFVANTYNRYQLALLRGEGSIAFDAAGKRYIDFTSGIGVNSLGFADKGWAAAVSEQASLLQHTSNLYYTQPVSEVAEHLIKRLGYATMFFANSGAEANEGAIKAARKYSFIHHHEKKRYEILTLNGSFHGRTMATITATGQDSFHKDFQPFLQGFNYVEANDISDLKKKVSDKTCAIMLEFIQGEGGVNDLSQEFVEAVSKICKKKDILLIADEVQTGIGRTGKLMSYQHYNIRPDIITVAKGLGGGLPIGGIVFNDKTKDALLPGDHGSTFGGNPVVCTGAKYVLDTLDDAFIEEVAKKGEYLKQKLQALPGVLAVSGKGLMLGVRCEGKAPDIVKRCLDNGLLLLTAKEKIRLLPPLNIGYEEIDEGLEIFTKSLS